MLIWLTFFIQALELARSIWPCITRWSTPGWSELSSWLSCRSCLLLSFSLFLIGRNNSCPLHESSNCLWIIDDKVINIIIVYYICYRVSFLRIALPPAIRSAVWRIVAQGLVSLLCCYSAIQAFFVFDWRRVSFASHKIIAPFYKRLVHFILFPLSLLLRWHFLFAVEHQYLILTLLWALLFALFLWRILLSQSGEVRLELLLPCSWRWVSVVRSVICFLLCALLKKFSVFWLTLTVVFVDLNTRHNVLVILIIIVDVVSLFVKHFRSCRGSIGRWLCGTGFLFLELIQFLLVHWILLFIKSISLWAVSL